MTNEKTFYTIKNLSLELGLSVSTIYNMIKDGYIKARQINGKGIWRISPAEFKRVVKENK